MSKYAVVRDGLVACAMGQWLDRPGAWRNLGLVNTWVTQEGARLFVDMNGGTVTPFSEVFDPSVILATVETDSPNGVPDHENDIEGLPDLRMAAGPAGDADQQVERDLMRALEPSSRLLVVWLIVTLLLSLTALAGCAALPMPLQPETEDNSNVAEGGFLVLATVDTVQTMHIRRGTSCDHEADPIAAALYGSKYPKPGRVLLTNLALMTVHTMLASWLDDKVAEHKALDDGSVGPWYVGRLTFHAVSLVAEGSAVASNASRGCRL